MIALLGRAILALVAVNVLLVLVAALVVFVVGFCRSLFGLEVKPKEPEEKKKRRAPPYETTREAPAPPPRELEPKKPEEKPNPSGQLYTWDELVEESIAELLDQVGGR
jgi:hypothetical protein